MSDNDDATADKPKDTEPPRDEEEDKQKADTLKDEDSDDENDKKEAAAAKRKKEKKQSVGSKIWNFVAELVGLRAFQQQELSYFKPVIRPIHIIGLFLFFGLLFLVIGIIIQAFSAAVHETKQYRYDNLCALNQECIFRFEVEHEMKAPVYIYYRLENFFQNHRRYVRSRSDSQLAGKSVSSYSRNRACSPEISVDDEDNSDAVWLPCGLQSLSFFNDTLTLTKDNNRPLAVTTNGVAWKSDLDHIYKDPGSGAQGTRVPWVPSFDDPQFVVWMKIAALPSFNKLYLIVNENMSPGIYRMRINNVFPVREFGGRKLFTLSTTEFIGGKNLFLGWAYIVIAIILLVLTAFFTIGWVVYPRKLGDTSYLEWSKQ